jgi:hypothetical protein
MTRLAKSDTLQLTILVSSYLHPGPSIADIASSAAVPLFIV